jgi:hypothetical protein
MRPKGHRGCPSHHPGRRNHHRPAAAPCRRRPPAAAPCRRRPPAAAPCPKRLPAVAPPRSATIGALTRLPVARHPVRHGPHRAARYATPPVTHAAPKMPVTHAVSTTPVTRGVPRIPATRAAPCGRSSPAGRTSTRYGCPGRTPPVGSTPIRPATATAIATAHRRPVSRRWASRRRTGAAHLGPRPATMPPVTRRVTARPGTRQASNQPAAGGARPSRTIPPPAAAGSRTRRADPPCRHRCMSRRPHPCRPRPCRRLLARPPRSCRPDHRTARRPDHRTARRPAGPAPRRRPGQPVSGRLRRAGQVCPRPAKGRSRRCGRPPPRPCRYGPARRPHRSHRGRWRPNCLGPGRPSSRRPGSARSRPAARASAWTRPVSCWDAARPPHGSHHREQPASRAEPPESQRALRPAPPGSPQTPRRALSGSPRTPHPAQSESQRTPRPAPPMARSTRRAPRISGGRPTRIAGKADAARTPEGYAAGPARNARFRSGNRRAGGPTPPRGRPRHPSPRPPRRRSRKGARSLAG